MPRVASRITLEITSIKIERLHEITDEQAIKEGILNYTDETGRRFKDYTADATGYGNSEIDYPTFTCCCRFNGIQHDVIKVRRDFERRLVVCCLK